MPLIKRGEKGSALSIEEHDGNLDHFTAADATNATAAAAALADADAAQAAADAAQADADAALAAAASKADAAATATALGLRLLASDLDAGVNTALATDPGAARDALGLGTAALLNAEDRETATCYHILTQTAYGMAETGVAADLLVSGTLQLTPVAGAITHVYPLDPATSAELPEVAEEQANRPLNALVSITDATAVSGEFELIYPNPAEAAVLTGLENRVTQTRIVNDDPAVTLTIKLAPSSAGRRTARWRGALTDVELEPSDELLARAFWIAGDLDVDQFVRPASWATISVVSGSAGTSTDPLKRNTPNALIGDLIVHQVVRVGGQAITLPTGIGWSYPIILPYISDGRLLQPAPNTRATRVTWAVAAADGTFAPGTFSGGTARTMSAAYRGVAAVRQYSAAYGDASTSINWPALPGPRAPNSWVVGILNASALTARVSPTGSTEDAFYDGGPSPSTSLSLWHYATGEAYAPSPTTVASCNWACTVLELSPRRID